MFRAGKGLQVAVTPPEAADLRTEAFDYSAFNPFDLAGSEVGWCRLRGTAATASGRKTSCDAATFSYVSWLFMPHMAVLTG